jgi:hypothetical protein
MTTATATATTTATANTGVLPLRQAQGQDDDVKTHDADVCEAAATMGWPCWLEGLDFRCRENYPTLRDEAAKDGAPRNRRSFDYGCTFAQDDNCCDLLRGDDAAYGEAGGEFGFAGAAEVHGFGGHVGVFEAGAGVEEDDAVGGFELACG